MQVQEGFCHVLVMAGRLMILYSPGHFCNHYSNGQKSPQSHSCRVIAYLVSCKPFLLHDLFVFFGSQSHFVILLSVYRQRLQNPSTGRTARQRGIPGSRTGARYRVHKFPCRAAGRPDLPRAYRVYKFPEHPPHARVRVAKLLIPLCSLFFFYVAFCCTFLMISRSSLGVRAILTGSFLCAHFCAFCAISRRFLTASPSRARRVIKLPAAPDALYTRSHGFSRLQDQIRRSQAPAPLSTAPGPISAICQ